MSVSLRAAVTLAVVLWVGLIVGNVVTIKLLGATVNQAMERSFFQAIALVVYVALLATWAQKG